MLNALRNRVQHGIQKVYALGNVDAMSTHHDLATEGELWPDAAGAARVAQYKQWLQVYLGDHESVFAPLRDDASEGQYYTVNLCSRLTRLLSARLVGQTPQPHPPSDEAEEFVSLREAQQEVLDDILRTSRWPMLIERVAQGHSYRGDAVLKAQYDADLDAVRLRSVDPGEFWPEYDEDDTDKLLAASLVWQVKPEDPKDKAIYFREERHDPGLITNRLWVAERAQGSDNVEGQYRRKEAPLGMLSRFADVPQTVETGINVIPLVLIPNLPIDETLPWGISDYAQIDDLQMGVNRRVSCAWNISDKHEELPIAVDESFVDEYRNFDFARKVIPLIQHEPEPKYIDYPGDAAQSMQQGQEMMLWLCLVGGVSPESLGLGDTAPAESGYAIRLRQMLTTSTVEKKRPLLHEGVTNILSAAMKLHSVHVRRRDVPKVEPLTPDEIEVDWSDGLPEDQQAEVQKASNIRSADLPVPDIELLRMVFPDRTDAALEAMLAQALAERQMAMEAFMGGGPEEFGGSAELGPGTLGETVTTQEEGAPY